MAEAALENHLKSRRKAARLSQNALAERVGVSRQAILAIEAGRNIPSTSLGLRLAYALGCGVEDLFRLVPDPGIRARLAPGEPGCETPSRVALGRVDGHWVAHDLPADGMSAADGIVTAIDGDKAVVRPFASSTRLQHNVLVAGCAPLLGAVAQRVDRRFSDARVTWLRAGNRRAMELLASGMVHMAGVHLSGDNGDGDTAAVARRALPGRRLFVVNLTRWRQGLVVLPGNPLGLETGADLLRPGLRVASREEGSGAHDLATRLLEAEGACLPADGGPLAASHREVARLVRCRSADAGIAIESAALAEGLDFVPLSEERFDLVVAADVAAGPPVSRIIETLDDASFRTEVEHLPGYDGSLSGQVTTVEAA